MTAAAVVLVVAASVGLAGGITVGMAGTLARAALPPPHARTNIDRAEPRPHVVRKELPPSSKTRLRFMKTISGRIS